MTLSHSLVPTSVELFDQTAKELITLGREISL